VWEGDRYLVVEDEPFVARALARLVRRFGEAVVARTVRAAKGHVSSGVPWRAFLLDLGLPDGSGLDVLRAVRSVFPRTPALVLTGHLEAELVNAVHDLGAQYTVKPLDDGRVQRFLEEVAATGRTSPGSPGTADAARIPSTLDGCIERLRELLPLRLDPLVRYAMGTIVAEIKANPDKYGNSAVSTAAAALGEDAPSLYRHGTVAERWTEGEVQALLARKGRGERPLSWSHIVLLGTVPSQAERTRLIERVLEEGLSVRELAAIVGHEGDRVNT
jgi:ActR/RegA family two-component response regulator